MIKKRIIQTILAGLIPMLLFGQQEDVDSLVLNNEVSIQKDDIIVLSKCTEDGINFRWAPTNVSTWKMGNSHGYTFERMSVDTNIYLPVGKGLFKPLAESEWPQVGAETELNYMHAAAKCIYEVSETQGFVNNANDLSIRHAFHMMCADFNKAAAEASGLSYLETDKSDASFGNYRIYTFDPETNESSDTFYFIDAFYGLDSVLSPDLELEELDGAIRLSWSGGGQMESEYSQLTAYHIERATDGKNFVRLNDQPFVRAITEFNINSRYTSFMDSVENGIKYQYRVIGLDAFADQTAPSNLVEGMGIDLVPPNTPFGLETDVIDNSEVQIDWLWEDTDLHGDLAGFNIYVSVDRESPFQKINEKLLSTNTNSYLDMNPPITGANYYQIEAVDESDNVTRSIAVVGQIVDMIPPQAPTNLEATIDSNGIILIQWEKPFDDDIQGYELFFSNSDKYEFIKKAIPMIENEFYVDSTTLRTLTKELYYKVCAVDWNFNRSEVSEKVLVMRPDIIPPAPALFIGYYVSKEGIQIEWMKSVSNDVASTVLERREAGKEWVVIDDFDSNNTIYIDKNAKPGIFYAYNLITIDDSGNQSMPDKTLVLEGHTPFFLADVEDVRLEKNGDQLDLSWDYENIEDHLFIIYKKDNDGDMITFKKLSGQSSFSIPFEETQDYTFAIKAQAKDGRFSKMSEQTSMD